VDLFKSLRFKSPAYALFRLKDMAKETHNYDALPTKTDPGDDKPPHPAAAMSHIHTLPILGIEDTEVARFGDLVCILYTVWYFTGRFS
jgi:hypothetical protein